MEMHEILSPFHAHARKGAAERLFVDRVNLITDMVITMQGFDDHTWDLAEGTMRKLAPRLYDLWDVVRSLEDCPQWLKPLAEYGPRT